MKLPLPALLACLLGLAGGAHATADVTELVVATVNNGHMIEMQRQARQFEAANRDIRLRWETLEEGVLRQRVTTDVASGGSRYDVLTIGMYETQIWARRGWLLPLDLPADYDADDLLPTVRRGLSLNGRLYALPFYAESSMLMLRTDLAAKAGVSLPERPSWSQVRDAAARMHDPAAGVYGICLRGKPGWGDNMALVTTMANAHGGQWFDMAWKPQLESRPWKDAVTLYVELLSRYGPPGAAADGYNELLTLFQEGRCAMWVDATVAASFVSDPRHSKVAGHVAFLQAPQAVTAKGANWLWAWALAVPSASRHPAAAQRFAAWATSRAYVQQVAASAGWAAVPTGTRQSTYDNAALARSAAFSAAERKAIDSVNPDDPTLPRSPYSGVQYAAIPEFQAIGVAVGQQIAAALAGRQSVPQALAAAQQACERALREGGYFGR